MATNNMPKFLEDYVTVNELIKKMNEVYPRGRMISEIEYYGDDFVVFKSSFYETNEETYPKATGFARQHKSEHKSWFEMAETKSRGRCLRIVFSEDTVIKAYAHNLKEKCMELVGDDKASAKELYERALQEVGIIEAELNHKNSQDMQYEIKKQLDSLNK